MSARGMSDTNEHHRQTSYTDPGSTSDIRSGRRMRMMQRRGRGRKSTSNMAARAPDLDASAPFLGRSRKITGNMFEAMTVSPMLISEALDPHTGIGSPREFRILEERAEKRKDTDPTSVGMGIATSVTRLVRKRTRAASLIEETREPS